MLNPKVHISITLVPLPTPPPIHLPWPSDSHNLFKGSTISCHSISNSTSFDNSHVVIARTAKMHTTITRVQNVFGFFTTVCFAVAALIACSDLLAPRAPSANVIVKDVQVFVLPFRPLPLQPTLSLPNPIPLPRTILADTHNATEFEAGHTTTRRKKKNTHMSASRSQLISPPCSHGTRNRSSSTCQLPGLRRIRRMRQSFGIRSLRVRVRIICRTLGRRL